VGQVIPVDGATGGLLSRQQLLDRYQLLLRTIDCVTRWVWWSGGGKGGLQQQQQQQQWAKWSIDTPPDGAMSPLLAWPQLLERY
jgi:hypothetical protein